MNDIILELPIKTVSEANNFDHWTRKYKRKNAQSIAIRWAYNQLNEPKLPENCIVELTRIAPRKLDKEDNLPFCFKHIKDVIADLIRPGLRPGRADDNQKISWIYKQEKGKPKEYAIRIRIIEKES